MSKQQKTSIKKQINNASTNFEKCADLHCSHIIKTSELFKLAMNSLGKSKTKKAKYITKFKQRMQCIDKHCAEAKNKFNTVINTVKISNLQKTKKTKKLNKNNSEKHNIQHAGAGQLTDQNIVNQIIISVNGTPDLITEINNALQNYNLQKSSTNEKVKALQTKYSSAELSGNQLYDFIYVNQKLTQYDSTKSPSLIWNHGVNNTKSITAKQLGTHIYIYKDTNTGLYKLLGVIIREAKMSTFEKISEVLTFIEL